jgi:hypothetical protein
MSKQLGATHNSSATSGGARVLQAAPSFRLRRLRSTVFRSTHPPTSTLPAASAPLRAVRPPARPPGRSRSAPTSSACAPPPTCASWPSPPRTNAVGWGRRSGSPSSCRRRPRPGRWAAYGPQQSAAAHRPQVSPEARSWRRTVVTPGPRSHTSRRLRVRTQPWQQRSLASPRRRCQQRRRRRCPGRREQQALYWRRQRFHRSNCRHGSPHRHRHSIILCCFRP